PYCCSGSSKGSTLLLTRCASGVQRCLRAAGKAPEGEREALRERAEGESARASRRGAAPRWTEERGLRRGKAARKGAPKASGKTCASEPKARARERAEGRPKRRPKASGKTGTRRRTVRRGRAPR